MSDDTPTQRYPAGGEPVPPAGANPPGAEPPTAPLPDEGASPTGATEPLAPDAEAPTELFAPPPPPPGTPGTGAGDEPPEKKSKALLITLISIGAALLLAIIILLILLFTGDGDEPEPTATPTSESPTPTPTPTPTQTEEPPPLPGPAIASFTGDPTSVDCSGGGTVPVDFSWATTGTALWFAPDLPDASAGGAPFPTTSTQTFNYECGQTGAQRIYTITVQGENGEKASQSVVIRETS
jgi:hypothetical protein